MKIGIIYVTRPGAGDDYHDDPLVKQLEPSLCEVVEASARVSLGAIVRNICTSVKYLRAGGYKCVVIINAFLDPKTDGLTEGAAWNPDSNTLRNLTSCFVPTKGGEVPPRMKCIRLMWSLWEHLKTDAVILVTTDGVDVTRRSERVLERAVSAGRACQIYNWRSNPLVIEDIVGELKETSVHV